MKFFIKNIILYSIGLIILYCLFCTFIPRKFFYPKNNLTPNEWTKAIEGINENKDAEIVFTGGSHTYRTFNPSIFEKSDIKIFNLGSSAQNILNTHYVLRNFISFFNPKLVVLEMFPISLAMNSTESFFNRLSQPRLSIQTFNEVLAINNINTYNAFFSELFKHLFLHNKYCAGYFDDKKKCIYEQEVKAGFSPYIGHSTNQIKETKDALDSKKKILVNEKQLSYFIKNLKLLKEKNLQVLVVIQPIPKYYLKSMPNYDTVVKQINTISNEYGLNFIDFNGMVDLDDYDDFYDDDHLNESGVEKFNIFFIKTIKEKGIID